MALDAQDAAEAAEERAAAMAEAAIAAALTELHIVDTVKTVGESSVDATSGTVTSPDGSMVTGLLRGIEPDRATAMSAGQHFIQDTGPDTETEYKQAIAAGSVDIGKVLDTSDDKARLLLITHHEGEKEVRVFVNRADAAVADQVGNDLLINSPVAIAGGTTLQLGTLIAGGTADSIGLFYEAVDTMASCRGRPPRRRDAS